MTPEAGNTSESRHAPFSEPHYDWLQIQDELGQAWYLHVYVFATGYLVICILVLPSMCYYFRDMQTLIKGRMVFSLQCLILTFASLRALALYVDPYHVTGSARSEAFLYLWVVATPGLTASFSVLLLVLLETTGTTLAPPRFQKLSALLTFTGAHFVLVTTFYSLASSLEACQVLLYVCQGIFILYGSALALGYTYATVAIYNTTKATLHLPGRGVENRKMFKIIKVGVFAAVVSLVVAVTNIYSATANLCFISDVTHGEIWQWWIVNTIMRVEELSSCCLILVLAFRNPCNRKLRIKEHVFHLSARIFPSTHSQRAEWASKSPLPPPRGGSNPNALSVYEL